jgi:hypoxia up-regulated 1
VVLVVLISVSSASVLGIDFGSEYFKVALIIPGRSFVIIENTTTKRKTENVVSFGNNERYYEADGASKRLKNSKSTFVFLKKFLGALSNDEKLINIAK